MAPPEVAVIARIDVPAGVPVVGVGVGVGDGTGVGVGVGGGGVEPPPPQATIKTARHTSANASTALRRNLPAFDFAASSRVIADAQNRNKYPGGTRGEILNENGATDPRAVVLTETVKLTGVPPFRVAEVGLTVQVEAAGAPLQAKLTLPAAPAVPMIVRL